MFIAIPCCPKPESCLASISSVNSILWALKNHNSIYIWKEYYPNARTATAVYIALQWLDSLTRGRHCSTKIGIELLVPWNHFFWQIWQLDSIISPNWRFFLPKLHWRSPDRQIGDFWAKNRQKKKYGSKCLELPNSSRNAIKFFCLSVTRARAIARARAAREKMRAIIMPNFDL